MLFPGFLLPSRIEMNNPAFESNGSVDGVPPEGNHETSLTELIPPPTLSMPEVMTSSSRRPSFLSVTNSELNSHTYVYDSTRSLNKMTVSNMIQRSWVRTLSGAGLFFSNASSQ